MRPIFDVAEWAGDLPVVLVEPAADSQARRLRLRALVARVLGLATEAVMVCHAEGRAPHLLAPSGTGVHLTSASREGMAAFAVGRSPLGVDIEAVEPGRELPWNVLHPDEGAWLAGLDAGDRDRSFALLWAVKEAYLKALGTGLAREPSSFPALPGEAAGTTSILDPERAGQGVSVSTAWFRWGERDFAVALVDLTG